MSTQQDIYAAGSENRPPMLNKENYVPWSSRLLRYAKSRPNGKFIYNSIMNGPYVRQMIPEPGDTDREVPVPETFHLSSGKQITTLNEEISNLSKQLSTEKSTVSSLLEEKKKLKSDFKIREDELLDKQIQLENKIKELDNILVKTGQSIQTMHMLSPKHDPPAVHDSEETRQLA
ncbi:hypothetical protein Tco_1358767 [Tanacetum coccineum]